MVADVVNISRTGALIRTPYEQRPGTEWPLLIEFNHVEVKMKARVVRCEPARAPRRRAHQEFAVAVVFVNLSEAAHALLDTICSQAADPSVASRSRRLCVSFVRRCPECRSRAVHKETARHYCCTDCGQRFTGIRVGIVRFAR